MNIFVLDSDTYDEVFGGLELLNETMDLFELDNEEKKDEESDDIDKVIKIFQVIKDVKGDTNELSMELKGSKLLTKILSLDYNKQVEKFEKFVKEKLEILDEKNIIFFINRFMRFDFSIYKKIFPSFKASVIALASAIVISAWVVFFFMSFYLWSSRN